MRLVQAWKKRRRITKTLEVAFVIEHEGQEVLKRLSFSQTADDVDAAGRARERTMFLIKALKESRRDALFSKYGDEWRKHDDMPGAFWAVDKYPADFVQTFSDIADKIGGIR